MTSAFWHGFWRLADPKISLASFASMFLGACAAAANGSLHFGWLAVTLLGIFSIEVAKNASGEIFDWNSGNDQAVQEQDRSPFSGGKRALMEQIAPAGPIYQAGTLSGNPVAMAAGLATLALVEQPGFHAALERSTRALCEGLEEAARAAGVAFTTNHVCGMFGLYFSAERVETYAQAMRSDAARFKRFFHAMLERGVYFAPSAFEAGFMSAAHGERDLDDTIAAAREAFALVAAA